MKRLGTVLVFKEGTTREEAVDALRKINDVLELRSLKYRNPHVDYGNMVQEFDDEYGGPVWYIP